MSEQRPSSSLAGPGIMLLSAAIFGYFGFFAVLWNTTGISGQFLLFVAILEWTLKASAVAFLLSAVIAFAQPQPANLVYSVVGLLGAIAFTVVLVLDVMDKQHMSISPVLLVIFAAWNGYGSWSGLRAVMAIRARDADEAHRPGSDGGGR